MKSKEIVNIKAIIILSTLEIIEIWYYLEGKKRTWDTRGFFWIFVMTAHIFFWEKKAIFCSFDTYKVTEKNLNDNNSVIKIGELKLLMYEIKFDDHNTNYKSTVFRRQVSITAAF